MMKKLILPILLVFSMFASSQDKFCDPALTDEVSKYIMKNGGEWLQDFNVYLPKASPMNVNPEASYKMVLSANTTYRFLIISSPKYKGEAQLTIQDKFGNLISSLTTKNNKIPKTSDISIKLTDIYSIKVNFLNGNEGCALFTICFINRQ